MNLAQFLAGRLAKGIVVLFAIAVLNFFLIRAAPGDPVRTRPTRHPTGTRLSRLISRSSAFAGRKESSPC